MEATSSTNPVLEKIKKASKKKRRKRLILLLVPLLVIFLGVSAYLIYRFFDNIRPSVTLEAGSPAPAAEDFLYESRSGMTCDTDLASIDMKKPGEHEIRFSWLFFHASSKLIVQDTVVPVGATKDLVVKVGEKPAPEDFVTDVQDVTKVSVYYSVEPNCIKEGVKTVGLVLEDEGGNKAVLPAKITVYDESRTPVISGAEDRTVYVGESISYRNGITITDELDPNPTLEIDNSQVNLDVPGVYPVTITVTDFCGRSSSASFKVHVEEKPANYQNVEMLNSKADERLKSLITDRMTDIEKAFQIFRWTRLQVPWVQTGSHENDADQAIMGLEGNPGDCYTHAIVCKVLLERAGFLVLMIEKNTMTGTHYWLKVNVDGNWYNMDPSPIYIKQFVPFLATDAELKTWADKWRPHLYELEQDTYPPTPMVSPVSVEYKDGDYILTMKNQH